MKYRALSVIAAADAPVKKPAPDVYLNALARLAIPAREALAIEDAAIGLRAPRAAGLDCRWRGTIARRMRTLPGRWVSRQT